jgi:hypothetical protein
MCHPRKWLQTIVDLVRLAGPERGVPLDEAGEPALPVLETVLAQEHLKCMLEVREFIDYKTGILTDGGRCTTRISVSLTHYTFSKSEFHRRVSVLCKVDEAGEPALPVLETVFAQEHLSISVHTSGYRGT